MPKTEKSYTVTETDIYRIQPLDTMTIEISVDELDVGTLAEGSYDSGNTKYTVVISLTRNQEMLSKMNAGIRIETGLSDGTNVQILSGLAQGETVYYRYADSLEYTFAPRK